MLHARDAPHTPNDTNLDFGIWAAGFKALFTMAQSLFAGLHKAARPVSRSTAAVRAIIALRKLRCFVDVFPESRRAWAVHYPRVSIASNDCTRACYSRHLWPFSDAGSDCALGHERVALALMVAISLPTVQSASHCAKIMLAQANISGHLTLSRARARLQYAVRRPGLTFGSACAA